MKPLPLVRFISLLAILTVTLISFPGYIPAATAAWHAIFPAGAGAALPSSLNAQACSKSLGNCVITAPEKAVYSPALGGLAYEVFSPYSSNPSLFNPTVMTSESGQYLGIMNASYLDAYSQVTVSKDGLTWDLYSLTGLPQGSYGANGLTWWSYDYAVKALAFDPYSKRYLSIIRDSYSYEDWSTGTYIYTQNYDIYSSTDGINWSHDAPLVADSYSYTGLAVDAYGTQVAFVQNYGTSPILMRRLPGKAWQVVPPVQASDAARMSKPLRSIRWNAVNGVFVAVGDGPNIIYSLDGYSWTQVPLQNLPTLPLRDVAFDDTGTAVAVGDHIIAIATDGYSNWYYQSGATQNFQHIDWDGHRFVASSASGIASSDTGASWKDWGSAAGSASLSDMVWTPYGMLGVGPQGHLLAADKNGSAWVDKSLTGSTLPDFEAVVMDEINPTPCFLIAGSNNGQGEVRYSCSSNPDVFNQYYWTASIGPSPLHGIAVNNLPGDTYAGTVVVVGNNGEINYRPKGASYSSSSWKQGNSGTTKRLNSVTHGNPNGTGLFVAGGDGATILTSQDGYTWTPATTNPISNWYNVSEVAWVDVYTDAVTKFSGFIAIAGYIGGGNYVYTSTDGQSWTKINSIAYGYHSGIGHDGKTIWIGSRQGSSYYQKLYKSQDGSTWTLDTQTTPISVITRNVFPAFAATQQGVVYKFFSDITPPQIILPLGMSSWTVGATGPNGIASNDSQIQGIFGGVYAYDAIDGYLFSTLSTAPPIPPVLPIGTTNIDFYATDLSGNQSTPVTLAITVVDQTPPVVTPPADLTVQATSALGTEAGNPLVAAFLNGATATDNVDTNLTVYSDAPAVFPLGTTTVTFWATDAAGNTGTTTATVTVTTGQSGTVGKAGCIVGSTSATAVSIPLLLLIALLCHRARTRRNT